MKLEYLARFEPVTALRTWYALDRWYESGMYERDGVMHTTTLEEAYDTWISPNLPQALADAGMPERVVDHVFGGWQGRSSSRSDIIRRIRQLQTHMDPPGRWCFEALANLGRRDDAHLCCGPNLNSIETAADVIVGRKWHSPDRWWAVIRDLRLISRAASMMVGKYKRGLSQREVNRLRVLAGAHLPAGAADTARSRSSRGSDDPRSQIAALLTQPAKALPRPLCYAQGKPLVEDIPAGYWVIARACGFVADYCLRHVTAYVRQCDVPHDLVAYLDARLGRRSKSDVCGTLYVADGGTSKCCARPACRKTQRVLGAPSILNEMLHERGQWPVFPWSCRWG